MVFAGFVVSNSETGHGSFSLTPQLTVQVCDNGMTITRDAVREVHLGGRLADGVVRWSADTQDAVLDLVGRPTASTTTSAPETGGRGLDRLDRVRLLGIDRVGGAEPAHPLQLPVVRVDGDDRGRARQVGSEYEAIEQGDGTWTDGDVVAFLAQGLDTLGWTRTRRSPTSPGGS